MTNESSSPDSGTSRSIASDGSSGQRLIQELTAEHNVALALGVELQYLRLFRRVSKFTSTAGSVYALRESKLRLSPKAVAQFQIILDAINEEEGTNLNLSDYLGVAVFINYEESGD